MTSTFSYYDNRWHDTYHIVHLNGRFVHALRFVDGLLTQPIVYDRLAELPQPARNDVEQRLEEEKK